MVPPESVCGGITVVWGDTRLPIIKRRTVDQEPTIDHLDRIAGHAYAPFDVFHSVCVPTEKDDDFTTLWKPEHWEANVSAI